MSVKSLPFKWTAELMLASLNNFQDSFAVKIVNFVEDSFLNSVLFTEFG